MARDSYHQTVRWVPPATKALAVEMTSSHSYGSSSLLPVPGTNFSAGAPGTWCQTTFCDKTEGEIKEVRSVVSRYRVSRPLGPLVGQGPSDDHCGLSDNPCLCGGHFYFVKESPCRSRFLGIVQDSVVVTNSTRLNSGVGRRPVLRLNQTRIPTILEEAGFWGTTLVAAGCRAGKLSTPRKGGLRGCCTWLLDDPVGLGEFLCAVVDSSSDLAVAGKRELKFITPSRWAPDDEKFVTILLDLFWYLEVLKCDLGNHGFSGTGNELRNRFGERALTRATGARGADKSRVTDGSSAIAEMDSDRVAWTRSRSIRVWELRVRISTRRRARGPGRAGETGNKTARADDARMISGNAKDTTRQNNKIKKHGTRGTEERNSGRESASRASKKLESRVTRGTRALPPHGIAGFDAHEAPTRNQITDFWVDRGLERDRMDARTPS
ncbi:hypothetical protein DFP72DRAFT_854080 [Ephemerocybe angulata]|uniref:Uncharacterized protein n=1 Tax=Ephemerocybe angulata TaxID=980116 RepID=A0A8H6M0L3_9AGAR|nr:hypothetical protein DFP72DRAFT_854080 [Tulosesus angulatus]